MCSNRMYGKNINTREQRERETRWLVRRYGLRSPQLRDANLRVADYEIVQGHGSVVALRKRPCAEHQDHGEGPQASTRPHPTRLAASRVA
jgi:hypothetical protein